MSNFIIEELKDSIIDSEVKFTCNEMDYNGMDILELIDTRKTYKKITTMIWITLRPVITNTNVLYNPKALIFRFLN